MVKGNLVKHQKVSKYYETDCRWYAFRYTKKTEVEAAEASVANNKKFEKERPKVKETRRLSMERLSQTQKRRSNSDDDIDITSPKQKKSVSSGTDTIVYLRQKTEKDFE